MGVVLSSSVASGRVRLRRRRAEDRPYHAGVEARARDGGRHRERAVDECHRGVDRWVAEAQRGVHRHPPHPVRVVRMHDDRQRGGGEDGSEPGAGGDERVALATEGERGVRHRLGLVAAVDGRVGNDDRLAVNDEGRPAGRQRREHRIQALDGRRAVEATELDAADGHAGQDAATARGGDHHRGGDEDEQTDAEREREAEQRAAWSASSAEQGGAGRSKCGGRHVAVGCASGLWRRIRPRPELLPHRRRRSATHRCITPGAGVRTSRRVSQVPRWLSRGPVAAVGTRCYTRRPSRPLGGRVFVCLSARPTPTPFRGVPWQESPVPGRARERRRP